jgi:predicted phosphodiesterase
MELGELKQTVMIFGGPYSNLAVTKALRLKAKELGISENHTICTGDLVAYCAEPVATVNHIRDWSIPIVMGNCEESLSEGAADCGCGFDEGSACSLLSAGWYEYARKKLPEEHCLWMGGLPRQIRFSLGGKRCLVVHGGVSRINQFVFSSTALAEKQRQLLMADTDVIIGGHCGLPFGERISLDDSCRGFWLNAGVIGMPANDGSQDGWYMLLTPEVDGRGFTASWHRLEYDVLDTQQKMINEGLNNAYAEALISGLWPSKDILPETEKQQSGQRLEVASLKVL